MHTFSTKSFGGYFIIPLCLLIGLSFTACENLDIEPKNFIESNNISITPVENSLDLFIVETSFAGFQTGNIQEEGFVWRRQKADGNYEELTLFLNDGKEPGDEFNKSEDEITFSSLITFPLFINTKVKAFIKIGNDVFYSDSLITTGIDDKLSVETLEYSYQGGFSLEASGRVSGLGKGITVSQHGFCFSFENDCPDFSESSCVFIDPGQLSNDTAFTLVIDSLKNNIPLFIRSFAKFVYSPEASTERYEQVKLGDCLSFDGNLNFWDEVGGIGNPPPRSLAVSFSVNGNGYIGTGLNGETGELLKDFWAFNPVTKEWTKKTSFSKITARQGAVAFSIGNKAYIGTGFGEEGLLDDFWEYDPIKDTLIEKASFGGGVRFSAVGFSIGNKGYIGTGFDGTMVKNDFWEYDPETNIWSPKKEFKGDPRWHAVSFSIDTLSYGYVGTGADISDKEYNDFWAYDPGTDSWTKEEEEFPGGYVQGAIGFSMDHKGYVGTGLDRGDNLKTEFWQFDPSGGLGNGQWNSRSVFPGLPRWFAVGFAIDKLGYLGTGMDFNGSPFNDIWVFDP